MTNPANMTGEISPAERQLEIARILSRAFLRLRQRGCCSSDDGSTKIGESDATCLEVARQTGLTVPTG